MRAIFPSVMLALYGVASVIYILHLFWQQPRLRRGGRVVLALGLAAHVGTIGGRCLVGSHPLLDTSGVLSLTGLVVGLLFVCCSYRWRLGALGAVVAPLVLMLAIASALTLQPVGAVHAAPAAGSLLLLRRLHLTLVALGLSAFGLAAAVSLLYLVQESALKSGKVGALNRRGPAITTLDNLGRGLVLIGFPIFTLAVGTGIVWALRMPGGKFRVDYLISALIWLVFAGLIVARSTIGLRGRRAAVLTLAGAGALLVVLALYVGRRVIGA